MDIQKIYYERLSQEKEYLGDDKPINKIDPVVSVCVATYQHAPFIKRCLDGILMQKTDFPIEIIIGEDGSSDGTREICIEYAEKYPDKIRLFLRERETSQLCDDHGQYICRFNGKWVRESAKGKYIAICEGDDCWVDSTKLKKQVAFLEANPDFVLCAHYVDKVDHKNEIVQKASIIDHNTYFSKNEIFHVHLPTLSLLYQNIRWKYDEPLIIAFNGDAVIRGLLAVHGKAALLNFVGAHYRIHAGGVHSSIRHFKKYSNSIKTRRLMLDSQNFGGLERREIKREISRKKRKAIRSAMRRFRILDAIRFIFL